MRQHALNHKFIIWIYYWIVECVADTIESVKRHCASDVWWQRRQRTQTHCGIVCILQLSRCMQMPSGKIKLSQNQCTPCCTAHCTLHTAHSTVHRRRRRWCWTILSYLCPLQVCNERVSNSSTSTDSHRATATTSNPIWIFTGLSRGMANRTVYGSSHHAPCNTIIFTKLHRICQC